MFQLRIVTVLSDVVLIYFSTIVVLTVKGNFWVVLLLHSVNDICIESREMVASTVVRKLIRQVNTTRETEEAAS